MARAGLTVAVADPTGSLDMAHTRMRRERFALQAVDSNIHNWIELEKRSLSYSKMMGLRLHG